VLFGEREKMKQKTVNILFLLVLLLGLLAALGRTLLMPKEYNYYENRYAVKLETPTLQGFLEGTVQENNEMISAGKVDIGFLTSEFEHPNVVTQSLAREKIVMVVPRSHPMAELANHAPKNDLATVDLNLFRDDEFLLAGKQTTLRTLEDRAFAQAGFMPKIAFETPSLVTLNSLSQSGYGISFVPSFYAKQVDEAVYFHTSPPISWELVAASRKGSHITEAENYMISLAAEYYNAPPKHHTR